MNSEMEFKKMFLAENKKDQTTKGRRGGRGTKVEGRRLRVASAGASQFSIFDYRSSILDLRLSVVLFL
jgi:hypothetical protein